MNKQQLKQHLLESATNAEEIKEINKIFDDPVYDQELDEDIEVELTNPIDDIYIKDCIVYKNEPITNVTDTWDFAAASTYTYTKPKNLDGIINAVKKAEEKGVKLRALGSRHSYSLVAQTDNWYIDTSLTNPYRAKKKGHKPENHNEDIKKLNKDSLKLLHNQPKHSGRSLEKENLMDIPASLRVWMLNHILCPGPKNPRDESFFDKDKRLFNMGGGDVQHFAGAFSTGTHGSGGKYAAYHDMVRSMVLVASSGKVYRIEPKNGITNKAKHDDFYRNKKTKIELIQDDDRFNSALVSMGCFGIFYSCIIEVTDMVNFYQEMIYSHNTKRAKTRHRIKWNNKFKKKFEKSVLQDEDDYYSIQINPYKLKKKKCHSLLERITNPKTIEPTNAKRVNRRQFFPTVIGSMKVSVKLSSPKKAIQII